MSNERRKSRIRERTNDQTPTSELFKHESTTPRIFSAFSVWNYRLCRMAKWSRWFFPDFNLKKSRNHQMNVLELFGQIYPTRFVQKIESESQFFRLFHLSQWSFVSVSTMSWKKIDNFSSKSRIFVGESWSVVCPTRLSGSQRSFSKVPEDNAASHVTLSIFGRRWPQDCEESFRFRLRTVPKSTDERRERTWPSYPTQISSGRKCWT